MGREGGGRVLLPQLAGALQGLDGSEQRAVVLVTEGRHCWSAGCIELLAASVPAGLWSHLHRALGGVCPRRALVTPAWRLSPQGLWSHLQVLLSHLSQPRPPTHLFPNSPTLRLHLFLRDGNVCAFRVLLFRHVGLRDRTRLVRLGGKPAEPSRWSLHLLILFPNPSSLPEDMDLR